MERFKNMPLVIGYHRVVEDFIASKRNSIPAMLTSCRMLERHLDWIGRRFRFISLDELGLWLEGGNRFAKPVAAITFDDGYRDVYYNAFPLLKRKGIPAAVFVVTDLLGTTRMLIHDRLYLLLVRAYSRWRCPQADLSRLLSGTRIRLPEIERMRNNTWDPHSVSTILLTALPQDEVSRVIDALEAEVTIEESNRHELHPLSWNMVAEMSRAGMTIGSHTKTHTFLHRSPDNPLLTIPRMSLWEYSCMDALGRFSSSILSCRVNGVFNFVAGC